MLRHQGAQYDRLLLRSLDDMPSSVDTMSPGAPLIAALSGLDTDPAVDTHYIIAVLPGQEISPEADDGVVTVEAATIAGTT